MVCPRWHLPGSSCAHCVVALSGQPMPLAPVRELEVTQHLVPSARSWV